ncbi:hypothetical protein SDC9_202711 [bioreactor metagenome]|uniref:Uncharacterized protein n=1 Tax=bioreactor metagenome TaxID=1076179 RepID=A0A645IVZ3_9ZZZZ
MAVIAKLEIFLLVSESVLEHPFELVCCFFSGVQVIAVFERVDTDFGQFGGAEIAQFEMVLEAAGDIGIGTHKSVEPGEARQDNDGIVVPFAIHAFEELVEFVDVVRSFLW